MANWKQQSVKDIVQEITDGNIVLPVIQRELVWREEQMEQLFNTWLKGYPFGAIICIKENQGTIPLFTYRDFIKDYVAGNINPTLPLNSLTKTHLFVIDGQQRLQTFYIGIKGSYNRKQLYFDLCSNIKESDNNFKFAYSGELKPNWYLVSALFDELFTYNDYLMVANEIIDKINIVDGNQKDIIKYNISTFFTKLINSNEGLSISEVLPIKTDIVAARQQMMELFRRLNNGGTVLTPYILVSSMLKVFDSTMRDFLREVAEDNIIFGIGQSELIKLLLILTDQPTKEMVHLTVVNQQNIDFANWVSANKDRIRETLEVVRQFLELSKNYYWFAPNKNRSAIPIYFLAYHIFHSKKSPDHFFDKFDTTDNNFKNMKKWLMISLLNEVFRSRGKGWSATTTGIRKIHNVLKDHKGKVFPVDELIKIYKNHPIHQFSADITADSINYFDQNYVLYLIYGGQSSFRQEDKDHIHPKNLLKKYKAEEINNIGNFQLIDFSTNRSKSDKEFGDWITNPNNIRDLQNFLNRHFIPSDKTLWYSKKYKSFLKERRVLIANELNKLM